MSQNDLPGYDPWKLASPPEHECGDPDCFDPDCEATPPEPDPDAAYDKMREDAAEERDFEL